VSTATFTGPGGASYVVPVGVTSMTMEAWGGSGAGQTGGGGTQSKGGYVKATMAVTPGETLTVWAGGVGIAGKMLPSGEGAGGYGGGGLGGRLYGGTGGGGGGGGASAVKGSTAGLCVVAGGGGAYGKGASMPGGNGGGTTGANGSQPTGLVNVRYGRGGTPTAGGAGGGDAPYSDHGQTGWGPFPFLSSGTLYSGGAAGDGWGGGGGAGYWGGGGGGGPSAGSVSPLVYGGGGGGSSFTKAGATGVVNTSGGATTIGSGQVVLTFNQPPKAPNLIFPINNVSLASTAVQLFQWANSFNEVGDTATGFDLRYRLVGGPTWTTLAHVVSAASQYSFAANTFATGTYEWQVRSRGSVSGNDGPWSASGVFSVIAPPAAPTVVTPAASEFIGNVLYTVTWNSVDGQEAYEVMIMDETLAVSLYDVLNENSSDNFATVTFPSESYPANVLVRVRVFGLWSAWTTVAVLVLIVPPVTPTLIAIPHGNDGTTPRITVSITNPAGSPVALYNDLYRSSAYDPEIRVAAGLAPNATWIDYTPANGIVYTYRAVAVSSNGGRASGL
jgi:hypothetical protein